MNVLLQVLDDGRLTDGKGRTVDFKNTIVIMTSNIGAYLIQEKLEGINGSNRKQIIEETRKEVDELLRKSIRPEFLNRIDEIVMFNPLSQSDILQIVKLQFNHVAGMLEKQGVVVQLTDEAAEWLAKEGYDPGYGARPIKRLIQRTLLNDLSKRLLSGDVSKDKPIVIDAGSEGLIYR